MADTTLRVLVVDDTVVYRKIVSDILGEMPNVEVVGTASNGKIAMTRIDQHQPDLLILDVEMPEADGLEVLAYIQRRKLKVGAVMLSSHTQKGSERTIQALELGAFDFIPKPESKAIAESRRAVQGDLSRVVGAFMRQREIQGLLRSRSGGVRPAPPRPAAKKPVIGRRSTGQPSHVVVIGISTGGPNALKEVLPKLPADLGVPVLVVQHMPPVFTKSLADSLNNKCALEVVEGQEGQVVKPNQVVIAPGGRHMKVVMAPDKMRKIVRLTTDPQENGCRPAADYLFRSVAQVYGGRVTAVVMTGMGCDGKLGMKLLKRQGAITIAQDEETCVVYGMPKEVIEAGVVDTISPLHGIANEICKTVQRTKKAVLV